jgi:hypothetical protein|tara:strand:+ start:10529 stop:10792 length:264 start_codon:yes stop_codon:yes gene_type:complete
MNNKSITDVRKISKDFKFTGLIKPLDTEVLDLKNDVLKLVEKMDVVEMGLQQINKQMKNKLEYQMKFIEKIQHSVNEIWLEIEKLVK